ARRRMGLDQTAVLCWDPSCGSRRMPGDILQARSRTTCEGKDSRSVFGPAENGSINQAHGRAFSKPPGHRGVATRKAALAAERGPSFESILRAEAHCRSKKPDFTVHVFDCHPIHNKTGTGRGPT